jgi:hypothetical protein
MPVESGRPQRPRVSQLGRGHEPVTVVERSTPLVAVSTERSSPRAGPTRNTLPPPELGLLCLEVGIVGLAGTPWLRHSFLALKGAFFVWLVALGADLLGHTCRVPGLAGAGFRRGRRLAGARARAIALVVALGLGVLVRGPLPGDEVPVPPRSAARTPLRNK